MATKFQTARKDSCGFVGLGDCGYYRNPKATETLLPRGPATGEGEYAWVNSGDRAYAPKVKSTSPDA